MESRITNVVRVQEAEESIDGVENKHRVAENHGVEK